ncbi:unnamed protein product [Schistosoma margrebowiei]|uniref:Uncharacterized protein n=1 Tax=Schistosoma margrebowiei TaxID=48269 RepID=A0A183M866_9TREM|nr:unnamed protein product [Schistosoma margrebowiei]
MTGVMTTHATRGPPTFAQSAPGHMPAESADPHIGFSGAYAPGERADEGITAYKLARLLEDDIGEMGFESKAKCSET